MVTRNVQRFNKKLKKYIEIRKRSRAKKNFSRTIKRKYFYGGFSCIKKNICKIKNLYAEPYISDCKALL